MTFTQWVAHGIAEGWCGPPVCQTHDGTPLSDAELDDFNLGDPCIYIVRIYEDAPTRSAVEASHSPSVWRKTGYTA